MGMRFLYKGILFILLLSACAQGRAPLVEESITDIEPAPYLHIVSSKKETLGLIAEWYTGSFKNWKQIAHFNNKGESSIVRLGESVFIPHRLLIRENPLNPQPVGSDKRGSAANKSSRETIVKEDADDVIADTRDSENKENSSEGIEGKDLDELHEMVDLFDDKESVSEDTVSENTISKEVSVETVVQPEPPKPTVIPVEIDNKERKRMELLQELLKK